MGERSTRTRVARNVATWVGSPRRSLLRETHLAASTWIGPGTQPPDRTDTPEVMMPSGPAPDCPPLPLEPRQPGLVDARLGVDDAADGVEARPVDRLLRRHGLVQHRAEHPDERRSQARAARCAQGDLEPAVGGER